MEAGSVLLAGVAGGVMVVLELICWPLRSVEDTLDKLFIFIFPLNLLSSCFSSCLPVIGWNQAGL